MRLILHVLADAWSDGFARQVALLHPGLNRGGWATHVVDTGGPRGAAQGFGPDVAYTAIAPRRGLDPRPWLAMRRLLAEVRPAVIHAWGVGALRLTAPLVMARGGPPLVAGGLCDGGRPGRLERWLLRTAAAVVAGDFGEAAALRRLGVREDRIVTIAPCAAPPLPPDRVARLREFDLPPATRLIVAAGAIERGHGIIEAVWAFDILKHVYPDLWLLVVGDGSQRARVEEFTRALAREDLRVRFAGQRPDGPGLLALAEVVWLLGEKGDRYAALEALAAGKPVVARRRPDRIEMLGEDETGALVRRADRHEIARATRRLLDDLAARKRCEAAATARAAVFGADGALALWTDLYARVAPRA